MTTTIKVKGSAAPADIVTLDPTTTGVLNGYEMSRPSGNVVQVVPGKVKPVVSLHAAHSRAGSLTFAVATEALATSLDALLSRRSLFTLSDTDRGIAGMDFAVAPGDNAIKVALDDQTQVVFIVTVQVVEQ